MTVPGSTLTEPVGPEAPRLRLARESASTPPGELDPDQQRRAPRLSATGPIGTGVKVTTTVVVTLVENRNADQRTENAGSG